MENFLSSWFPSGTTLTAVDLLVFAVFIVALLFVGFRFGKTDETTEDFFLAHRGIPPWAACFSFVATEVTALAIIGLPAIAFKENWQYAQFFVGAAAARIVIAYFFIPAFYRAPCATIYEFLRRRFGPLTQYAAGLFFVATRLLVSGVRLMAASMAVSVLLGWPVLPAIVLFTAVSTAYLAYGGIRAAVWTNVFQTAVFIAAGIVVLIFLSGHIQGGLGAAWAIADSAGRASLWNFGLSESNLLWFAVLNGFIGSLATTGTDHEMMQRLLIGKTDRESRRAMFYTIPVSLFVMLLYLCIGTALFVYYTQHPELALPKEVDKILPHFTVQAMPVVFRGLILSAIFMASVDSPLVSLAASFVTDIYRPLFNKNADERHYMLVSRIGVVVFGLALAGLAWFFSFHEGSLWLGFKIGAVTLGPLLGVFLLGLMTQRRGDITMAAALLLMGGLNLWLLSLSERGIFPVGWNWLLAFGAAGAFGIGWAREPAFQWSRREVLKFPPFLKSALNRIKQSLPR